VTFFILGGGSNLLFSDYGFDGIVARLTGEFQLITFGMSVVKAGSGVRLGGLIQKAVFRSLSGLECMAGVPGTLGGALAGNAGTSEGAIGDLVSEVDVLSDTGQVQTLKKEEIQFFYRSSSLRNACILAATLNLKKAPKNDILDHIKDLISRRAEVQPLDAWSAGSVFKNPEGLSAGKLIEEAGLKGLTFGGAQVSQKHANFIINTGSAKASDVRTLIKMVHNKVKETKGVSLELEIKMIGE